MAGEVSCVALVALQKSRTGMAKPPKGLGFADVASRAGRKEWRRSAEKTTPIQPTGALVSTTEKLKKAFSDAIPLGSHPQPHAEWIQVRLDFIREAIVHMDSLEVEASISHNSARSAIMQARAARATARVAINHLQAVLNKPITHAEQQAADRAARDWLESIGSEPS